jgi:uncharacterized protein (DUF2249 family)
LVNNHDPKHLRAEFDADHPGSYGWEYTKLTMRRTFRKHPERLTAVAIVARKPEQPGRS